MIPDRPSFEVAFPDLFRTGYRAAVRIVASDAVAEDIAAEAAYRAAVHWARIENVHQFWVARVATNLAIDHVRRDTRRRGVEPVGDDQASRSDATAARLDLMQAISRLPRRQQQVVLLTHFGDMTQPEIAKQLRISVGAVKRHSGRAMEALRRSPALRSTGQT